MRKTVLEPFQKFMLSKRSLIETIIGEINVLSALVAYVFVPNKSSVSFRDMNGLGKKWPRSRFGKKMMMLTSN